MPSVVLRMLMKLLTKFSSSLRRSSVPSVSPDSAPDDSMSPFFISCAGFTATLALLLLLVPLVWARCLLDFPEGKKTYLLNINHQSILSSNYGVQINFSISNTEISKIGGMSRGVGGPSHCFLINLINLTLDISKFSLSVQLSSR